jgi:hypothetical protein
MKAGRILIQLGLLCVAMLPVAVQAQFTFATNNGAIIITGYTGVPTALNIPSTTNGYSVTSIGADAFQFCSSLASVTIPDSVTNIGHGAFAFCGNLNCITIPDSVIRIGSYAFWNCTNLTSATISTNIASIDVSAFESCVKLTNAAIPIGVTNIGSSAFQNCFNLSSVTIHANVAGVGRYAFDACGSLTAILVDLENTNYTSMDGVLLNRSQTALIQCPGGKAGSYTVPSSVANIGNLAFDSCAGLASVAISNGVTSIGDSAFASCANLTSVTIPASVTNIGSYAFDDCGSLMAIVVDPQNTNYSSADGMLLNSSQSVLIQCPAGKAGSCTPPNTVTNIGNFAFDSCSDLTSVAISNGVITIGCYAFRACRGLTSMTIPGNVNIIRDHAFEECTSLTNVTIDANANRGSIRNYAFASCTNLLAVLIRGNSPYTNDAVNVFDGDSMATVFYLPLTFWWSSTFDGLPTALWPIQVQGAQTTFGLPTGQFGFTINWAGGLTVHVYACTNLANNIWTLVGTNTLDANGSAYFSDAQWTNYPSRYYFVVYGL